MDIKYKQAILLVRRQLEMIVTELELNKAPINNKRGITWK